MGGFPIGAVEGAYLLVFLSKDCEKRLIIVALRPGCKAKSVEGEQKRLKKTFKIFCCVESSLYLCSPKFYGLEDIYKYVTAYQNKAEILRPQPG